ncbi:MAG: toxin-antitoxin system, antitoxin component, Xre family protein [Catonella sp.]|nr:MAG: toxin-antitoxin system, antitoxin component, Xre family protein [Catonella sp.]
MDNKKLKAAIVASGYRIDDFIAEVANKVEFTRDMYYSRVSGRTEFKRSEIAACKEVLGLTDEETINIFIR